MSKERLERQSLEGLYRFIRKQARGEAYLAALLNQILGRLGIYLYLVLESIRLWNSCNFLLPYAGFQTPGKPYGGTSI